MSANRARIWVGASAPSDSDTPNKPLDTENCFWFDTTNDQWKKLTARIPVDTWDQAAAPVSGGIVWGDITGTLSNQTDLNTALSGKAASVHTHAAGDTTSGVFDIARIPTGSTGSTVS